jgi:hypothetical protein
MLGRTELAEAVRRGTDRLPAAEGYFRRGKTAYLR